MATRRQAGQAPTRTSTGPSTGRPAGGYGPQIEAWLRDLGRPATVTEWQEAVGMSRQAAYQWRDRHLADGKLREVGKGRSNAATYELVPDSEQPRTIRVRGGWQVPASMDVQGRRAGNGEVRGQDQGQARGQVQEPVGLGTVLEVVGLRRADSGEVVLDLRGETGQLSVAVLDG